MQIFRLSTARMKINRTPCHFWSNESVFTWILYHLSVSWKISRFLSALIKVHPIPHASFETTRSRFIKTLHHSSVSWEIILLYFFSWKCTWFGQKKPIKVQNFRLSTAHLKFHQICTLIGSLKYKILAKKYRGVISHDPEDWCKIWRKTDLLFQKWQEFGEFWPEHSKV